MKNSFKTILRHSRIQYPARLFLLAIGLALLSSGLATPAFADDLRLFALRTGYFLCVRDSGGDTETMLKCVKDEQKFQDERLATNYQAYLKTKSPDDQEDENILEEDWERDRKISCSFPRGSDHAAELKRGLCYLNMTAYKARQFGDRLEDAQKEKK